MQIALFDPEGGPLIAEVLSAHAQPGSYTILLWEADANQVVFTARGNFINPDDDAHRLPGDAVEQAGRLVETIATVVVTPPIEQYRVSLRVIQDDTVLAVETQDGTAPTLGTVTVDLFIGLEPTEPAVAEPGADDAEDLP
jgi:hypothetical protein